MVDVMGRSSNCLFEPGRRRFRVLSWPLLRCARCQSCVWKTCRQDWRRNEHLARWHGPGTNIEVDKTYRRQKFHKRIIERELAIELCLMLLIAVAFSRTMCLLNIFQAQSFPISKCCECYATPSAHSVSRINACPLIRITHDIPALFKVFSTPPPLAESDLNINPQINPYILLILLHRPKPQPTLLLHPAIHTIHRRPSATPAHSRRTRPREGSPSATSAR